MAVVKRSRSCSGISDTRAQGDASLPGLGCAPARPSQGVAGRDSRTTVNT
jgi:hypothetical protein